MKRVYYDNGEIMHLDHSAKDLPLPKRNPDLMVLVGLASFVALLLVALPLALNLFLSQ